MELQWVGLVVASLASLEAVDLLVVLVVDVLLVQMEEQDLGDKVVAEVEVAVLQA
jgi:hypothetical protein